MRSDAMQRLLTISGGGLTVKSGVTGVAPVAGPLELQPVTPAAWKNPQLDQAVTPVTPCHTVELGGCKGVVGTNGIRGFRPSVTLSVTAAEGLARLDAGSPPCDVPMTRWAHFIDDCRRFLDDGWANCAERLGWTALDLFGCDNTKPLVRISRAGLLWLLNGRKLCALTADAATIVTASGGYLSFRRCLREPGGVLAWEPTT
jgi:hypothetical protein